MIKIFRVLFLILGLTVLANSQSETRFCGTVTDENNAVIPKARVELRLNKKIKINIETNLEGNFDTKIPDGIYKILIKADGFKKAVLDKQTLPYNPAKCTQFRVKSSVSPHQIT